MLNMKSSYITSVNQQMIRITWPFILIVALLFAINHISMNVLSSIRAFVTAESFYSKAQKDASYYLIQFANSHSNNDYQNFTNALAIPLADHQARLALQKTPPDIFLAKESFIKAKNDPQDVDGMINLFLRFDNINLMQEPIKIWIAADRNIEELKLAGQDLNKIIQSGNIDNNKINSLIYRINLLNSQLSIQEDAFSSSLGKSSRQLRTFIDVFRLSIATLLVILGLFFTRRIVLQNIAANHKLLQNELRLKSVLNTAMDAVVQILPDGTITGWTGQAENIFGWTSIEAVGRPLHELIIPHQFIQAHLAGMRHFMATGEGPVLNKRIEITALRRDRSEFPVELTISHHGSGNNVEFSAFLRDITDRKNSADQLFNLAHYDVITNLPNRLLFYDRLEQELKKSQRTPTQLAIILLDLDHFKEVNDTLGHDKGDVLLKEVAQRLKHCIRDTDTVARLGGDEFTLILPYNSDLHVIERVAQNILVSLAEPFKLGASPVYISGSMGITLFPDDAISIEELLQNADQAMYAAKNQGRNQYSYFTSAMQSYAKERAILASDLRVAISEQQFVLLYQPIVNLANKRIEKAEALIRWVHPIKGVIPPVEFIPIAEQTGLILEIGEWVFQEAAKQVGKWRERYNSDFQISVNKSPVQFYDRSTGHSSWSDQLKEMGLPRNSIVVEITESLLLDASNHVTNQLATLRSDGFKIAIDDFGTGYSSLSYLKQFEVDYLKIDKSFISQLKSDSSDLALCEAIIVMAHKLGIKVIAEGVETEEQSNLLFAAGCDYAQGYLFSKPVSPEKFDELGNHPINKTHHNVEIGTES
ncbi:MAG: GGDEF domain-containing protein [Methylotenera sp.]|nr:MAG: GGDEF domain-containing protein [Methylotenera sp.]